MLVLPHTIKRNPTLLLFHRLLSHHSSSSWLSIPGNPLLKWPSQPQTQSSNNYDNHNDISQPQQQQQKQDQDPLLQRNTKIISNLLKDISHNPTTLQSALDQTGIEPHPLLLQNIFQSSQFSPKPVHALYLWATKHPDFLPTPSLFNSIIDLLSKSRTFDSAWSLIVDHLHRNDPSSPISIDTFVILIRRYARAGMPQAAIRTFEFMKNLGPAWTNSNSDPLNLLLDALCKEGHVNAASCHFQQIREEYGPGWVPSIRAYNILLNGYFRSRKLRKAERLWEEMKMENVVPTVVTYGTLIEGYCRMRRVERAIGLLDEMKQAAIELNMVIYNPIVDALAEARRFKEALGMLERISVYGLSPNIATFNSLVKGFCKAGDLVGASKILKTMIERGCLPTSTTYNYFFRYFMKFGKVEEGMNLYTKMIESGYSPDRLTYHLLIKLLCECDRLDLAVKVVKEMNVRGCDSDLATSTMLVHLLCRLRRLEEACVELEAMVKRGIVPQYITYRMLAKEMKKSGMVEMARKLSDLMDSVPHSTKLPGTYRDGEEGPRKERLAIMRKAQVMSDVLKICRDPRELSKRRGSSENAVASVNQLIADIQRKVCTT
ncbi:pentatricopeptide repeat-containing protein At5g11310, mitochondrial [Magnolia sinica]|uniref:pentatricopeptide repeat-containing protein At5g11310, mitochondrial n=1 Tax=Magnolia sinica TaxID=86752 RepID=UPI00265B324C|nr:pentatricopeptide repeat-containing protein At5g11310, mitochondrial [Magnolia sinica]